LRHCNEEGDQEGFRQDRTALAALVRGDRDDASRRFDAEIERAGDENLQALNAKASLFMFVDPGISIDALQRALALDPQQRTLHWSLGCILEAMGRHGEAELSLHRAYELELQAGEFADAASSLMALARIAVEKKDDSLAAMRWREAVTLFERADNRGAAAEALSKLADNEVQHGDSDAAYDHYSRAIAHYQQIDAKEDEGKTLLARAEIERDRKSFDAALASIERARTLAAQAGSAWLECHSWSSRGFALADKEDLAEASVSFKKSADLAVAAGDESQQAVMLWMHGDTLCDLGKPAEAAGELRQAAALFEKLGCQEELKQARESLARIGSKAPRPVPPPRQYPFDTREYYWDRILHGHLVESDASPMLAFITKAALDARGSTQAPTGAAPADDHRSLTDFGEVMLDFNDRADTDEQLVLSQLVSGRPDDAASRCETIVARGGEDAAKKLWCKGALFVTIDPAVTRDAWQRLLAISADFHYARCAYGRLLERMYDIAGAEAQFREVISRADGDPRSQSMATDFLGTMARAREDWPAATSYFERSLELYRKAGDALGERLTLEMLGHIAAQSGDVTVSEIYCARRSISVSAIATPTLSSGCSRRWRPLQRLAAMRMKPRG